MNPRLATLLVLTLTVSSIGIISWNIPPNVSAASPGTIALIGFFSAWNNTSTPNPTITVQQGGTVTIQLSSGDGIVHRFFVDVDKNGPTPDCPGADVCSNAFTSPTTLTFTVNFASGIYTYYCSVHPTTMIGRFIVLVPPITGGGGRGMLQE